MFLVGEIGLRIYIDYRYSENNFKNIKYHEGSSLYYRETLIDSELSYLTNYPLNKDRFRDYNYSYKKADDIIRIAVVGDSQTFGLGIEELDYIFPKILEEKLNKNSNQKFEVMNFGWAGLNFLDIFWLIKYRVKEYNPDYILYAFFPNDLEFSRINTNVNYCYLFSNPNSYVVNYLNRKLDNMLINIYGNYNETTYPFYISKINKHNYHSHECLKNVLKKIKRLSEENFKFIIFSIPHQREENEFDKEISSNLQKLTEKYDIITIYHFKESFWNSTSDNEQYIFNQDTHYNEKAHLIFSNILYEYIKNET